MRVEQRSNCARSLRLAKSSKFDTEGGSILKSTSIARQPTTVGNGLRGHECPQCCAARLQVAYRCHLQLLWCAAAETASDESRNDSEHRASGRHPGGRAVTLLRTGVTHVSHPALLRPARQRRTQELPRDVRQILCLSLTCLRCLLELHWLYKHRRFSAQQCPIYIW